MFHRNGRVATQYLLLYKLETLWYTEVFIFASIRRKLSFFQLKYFKKVMGDEERNGWKVVILKRISIPGRGVPHDIFRFHCNYNEREDRFLTMGGVNFADKTCLRYDGDPPLDGSRIAGPCKPVMWFWALRKVAHSHPECHNRHVMHPVWK